MGLPVVSIDPETYKNSSTWIQENLGISKTWQADFMQINGMELLSGFLVAGGILLGVKKADTDQLLEIAGSSGLAGILFANPLVMLGAAVCLLISWKACKAGESKLSLENSIVGAGSAGSAILTGSLLGGFAASGTLPLIITMILSLVAGMTARSFLKNKLTRNKKVEDMEIEIIKDAELLWEKHLEKQRLQIEDRYGKETLTVLRTAFS
jgi:phosphotransferase system  glucose/maltose/N-acetylglucosamine-specific IIC component